MNLLAPGDVARVFTELICNDLDERGGQASFGCSNKALPFLLFEVFSLSSKALPNCKISK